MKHIIAAVDFSDNANNAASYAAELAVRVRAHLNLLYVFPLMVPFTDGSMPPFYIENAEEEGGKLLDELKEKLLLQTGRRITIHTSVEGGSFINELEEYCKKIVPVAVVIGAESETALGRVIFGSEAISALKNLTWPLIVVPSNKRFKEISRIGLACDLDDVAESVRIREIKDWVEEFDAELHVIHINPSFDKPISRQKAEESAWLMSMLGEVQPKYHYPHKGDLEQGIGEYTKKLALDLLIILPKSHSLLEQIFRPSKSKKIMLNAEVPVMSLHA